MQLARCWICCFRSPGTAVAFPRHSSGDCYPSDYHCGLRVISQEAEGKGGERNARK